MDKEKIDAILELLHNIMESSFLMEKLKNGIEEFGELKTVILFLADCISQWEEPIRQKEGPIPSVWQDNVGMLKAIMDGLSEWIIVISEDNHEIVYANQSAKYLFYDIETNQHICGRTCKLMEMLKYNSKASEESFTCEFCCPMSHKVLTVKSSFIKWNGILAYVHVITDVTFEKKQQEEMETKAYRDELTGLYNRRYCMEYLVHLLKEKREFSFCMADLDGLKFVNDHFGHTAGDAYLKTVSQQLKQGMQVTDGICRIGGDEFAILFPECKEAIALDMMKRIDKNIIHLAGEYPMSISYGVIHIEKGTNILPETIVSLADQRMYVLKNIRKEKKKEL